MSTTPFIIGPDEIAPKKGSKIVIGSSDIEGTGSLPQSIMLSPGETVPIHKEVELPPLPVIEKAKLLAFGTEALPAIGATGLALASGGASIPATVGAAILGGGGGEAARQLLQRITGRNAPETSAEAAKKIGISGAEQGAFELGGRVIAGPFQWALGGPLKNAASSLASKEALEASERLGLRLTPAEISGETAGGYAARTIQHLGMTSVPGSPIAAKARKEGLSAAQKAVDDFLTELHSPTSPTAAGTAAQGTFVKASQFFHKRGSELLHEALDKMPGASVDIAPVENEAARVVREEISPLAERFPKLGAPETKEAKIVTGLTGASTSQQIPRGARTSLEQLIANMRSKGNEAGIAAILEQIGGLQGEIPFEMAENLRSRLLALSREGGETATNRSRGLAKRLSSMLLDQMNKSAAKASPEALKSWQAFRDYYRKGSEVFERGVIRNLAETDPEKVVLAMDTPSKSAEIKKALLGYTPAKTAASRQPIYDMLRREWLAQKIVGIKGTKEAGPAALAGLQDAVDANRNTIKILFNDPKGKETIANIERLGRVMSRVTKTSGMSFLGIYELLRAAGALASFKLGYGYEGLLTFEGLPYVITKVLYSPKANDMLIRGIAELPKSTSTGVASIARAIQVTNQYNKARKGPVALHTEETLPPAPNMGAIQ